MTPNQFVHDAKGVVDVASHGASKMNDWVKETQKMAKAGEALSEIEAVVSTLAFVSKLSMALQVVSVGLTVVQMFLPVKSKEDQILDAVKNLSNQVTSMHDQTKQQIDEVKDTVWNATKLNTLNSHLEDIKSAKNLMNSVALARKAGTVDKVNEDALRTFDTHKLKKAVEHIEAVMAGTLLGKNLMKLVYDDCYGDPRKVIPFVGYLSNMAQLALAAHSASLELQGHHSATAADPWTEAKSTSQAAQLAGASTDQGSYSGLIKSITALACKWSQACIDEETRFANIKRFFDDKAQYSFPMLATDNQGSADRTLRALSKQWPWLNFTVICYDNMVGFDHHLISGVVLHRVIARLHFKDINQEKMNCVIYVAPRTKASKPRVVRTVAAARTRTQPYRKALDAFGAQLNMHKRFGFGLWNENHMDDVRDFLPIYGLLLSPSKPKRSAREMVWVAWNDRHQFQDDLNPDADKFLGLASQNPVSLYRNYIVEPKIDNGNNRWDERYLQGYYAMSVRDDAM